MVRLLPDDTGLTADATVTLRYDKAANPSDHQVSLFMFGGYD
ncbi:hypothetical protein B0I31_102166 [Saccharothrix carnea]|uniref:Uncharacterized protein n=1 Tax=Saccharothrix carnea TaxID=1280637 RepID=A0A2P8IFE2_SACCR|nr:hypothetical protein [Saccharothrix carnea]PSL57188.1 hypothetical protein B0I31_102166 [Saccharothrix carnea]